MTEALLAFAGRIGADPAETEDERVRRLIWSTTLILAAPLSALMAVAFAVLGLPMAAAVWAIGAAFWLADLLLFGVLRRGLDSFALASQLACVVFGCAGSISLGGPLYSGGLILMGLTGPFYALVFPRPRRAAWLLAAYIASIAASIALAGMIPWAQALPPVVNLVMFGATLTVVAVFVFVTLRYFVRERDRALGLLREAQDRISRLIASSPRASETVPEWSRSLAKEIGDAVGAEGIGIWEMEDGRLIPVSNDDLPPPSVDDLHAAMSGAGSRFIERADGVMVPLAGMSGELCGALVVRGPGAGRSDSERRLLAGFAHQLGAALDMSRMRRHLAAAEQRRARTRREMQERGIATLQVCRACGRCYDHTAARCAVDEAPLESPRTLPYLLLNRYRFLRVLGQGGMGMVLAAHDERLGRDVAVKLVRAEHFNDQGMKDRFEREARAVARIQHPGVIGLYDSGELEDGTAFLVMEKLTGCDLSAVLRSSGRGTPAQVAVLVREGSAALGAAHRAGVVHRDVKPENIFLVDAPGGFLVKVLDFGLAKSMTLERGLTQTGMMVGTPRYMSPEQVRGEDLDAGTDVYSFAAVCYEALTGRQVVSGDDLARILINVCSEAPVAPSSIVPGLPPAVDPVFAAALSKDRARRPAGIELWGAAAARVLERLRPDPEAAGWPSPGEVSPEGRSPQPGETETVAPDRPSGPESTAKTARIDVGDGGRCR
ncbi:MAG: serine/threonine-protein kinase [Vicinamibacterales bacterium]